MSQSLSKINVHIVFSTKGRYPFIKSCYRDDLHSYITGVLAKLGSYEFAIYANTDHIHILCTLPKCMSISELISKVKSSSSKWMKTQGIEKFSWQRGYGAFSVSEKDKKMICNYIQNQEEHHKKTIFKKEFILQLKEFKIEYNENYLWD